MTLAQRIAHAALCWRCTRCSKLCTPHEGTHSGDATLDGLCPRCWVRETKRRTAPLEDGT